MRTVSQLLVDHNVENIYLGFWCTLGAALSDLEAIHNLTERVDVMNMNLFEFLLVSFPCNQKRTTSMWIPATFDFVWGEVDT